MVNRKLLVGPADSIYLPQVSFGKLMHDGIKAKNRSAVAIIDAFTKSETTYGDLLDSTRQLACGLGKLGLGKSDVITIIDETTVNYCIPVLSCMYLGATVNPINPAFTKFEFLHALSITKPRFIICSQLVLNQILPLRGELASLERVIVIGKDVTGQTIDLSTVIEMGADGVNDFQLEEVDWKEDVAAILCSSGTTGLPKGVMLTHENIQGPLKYLYEERYRSIGPEDIIVSIAPCFHIFGLLIQLSVIYYNSKLIVMGKFHPEVLLQNIQEHRVNKLLIVPAIAVFLAKSPLVLQYDTSSVVDVICGAAPMGKDVQQLLEKRFKVNVRQFYGMTESTGGMTICVQGFSAPYSVGVVVSGLTMKVVDIDTNDMLPAHRTGEIRVKGYTVMKGYVGNKEATREAFDSDGFLCTGDIGYYDEEGNVFVVDRLKELIKYKGFQVSPSELEDVLLSHPEIIDSCVIGIPDERAGELPIAFVVKLPGATINEEDVVDYVAGLVSVQKRLYGGVRFINEIPKNPSGKVLRKILRNLYEKDTTSKY